MIEDLCAGVDKTLVSPNILQLLGSTNAVEPRRFSVCCRATNAFRDIFRDASRELLNVLADILPHGLTLELYGHVHELRGAAAPEIEVGRRFGGRIDVPLAAGLVVGHKSGVQTQQLRELNLRPPLPPPIEVHSTVDAILVLG